MPWLVIEGSCMSLMYPGRLWRYSNQQSIIVLFKASATGRGNFAKTHEIGVSLAICIPWVQAIARCLNDGLM